MHQENAAVSLFAKGDFSEAWAPVLASWLGRSRTPVQMAALDAPPRSFWMPQSLKCGWFSVSLHVHCGPNVTNENAAPLPPGPQTLIRANFGISSSAPITPIDNQNLTFDLTTDKPSQSRCRYVKPAATELFICAESRRPSRPCDQHDGLVCDSTEGRGPTGRGDGPHDGMNHA